jgi:ABC-type Zn uptake system ZnuABC Zn-binding protein ZnuA
MELQNMKRIVLIVLISLIASVSLATVRAVTSLPDLADFVKQIGGDRVNVDFIARGDQNPHFIEVKPSYMMKLKSADVFFTIGMELELWAQQLIDGSRNSSLNVVDLSQGIQKLEVPARVDASQGDVHRFGNPHYWLDPRNVRVIVGEIVAALSKASPSDERIFQTNADAYLRTLEGNIVQWQELMKPFAGSKIITFHRSWSYFANWLGLEVTDQVEPKPGIPPSPSHTIELITKIRQLKIKAIVVEPFYDTSAPEQLARSTGARVLSLATSVGGVPEATSYIALIDYNVKTLAAALR